MHKSKPGKEYPFVRVINGQVEITMVSNEPGVGYSYLVIESNGAIISECMDDSECEKCLSDDGFVYFQEAIRNGLLPSDWKLPDIQNGFARVRL